MPKYTAILSDDARRGWGRLMRAERTSLAGLMEAMGLSLDDRSWDGPPEEIVERAAEIDRERGSR